MQFSDMLGLRRVRGLPFMWGGSGSPTGPSLIAPIPSNYEFLHFGDSRSDTSQVSNTLGASGFILQTNSGGYLPYLPSLANHKVRAGRFSNFGIASSNTTQGAANPRQTWFNTITTGKFYRGVEPDSGSDNKGYVQAGQHDAGIVVLLEGTNDHDVDYPVTSRTNVLAIINGIQAAAAAAGKPPKVIIILNETPRGRLDDGTLRPSDPYKVGFKEYSDWLYSLDYASGSANARSDVIAVDTWGSFLDATSGGNYYNKRGLLYDGLHPNAAGGMLMASLIVARLDTAWGASWRSGTPTYSIPPAANGLTTPGAQAPYITSNPILTPGTAGTVSGSFGGTPPTAATVPQGWTLSISGTGASSLTVTSDKSSETDSDGFPVWVITVNGTLTAGQSASVLLSQTLGGSALTTEITAGRIASTDKYRAQSKLKVDAGSTGLFGATLTALVSDGTASHTQSMVASGASSSWDLNNGSFDTFAGSPWITYVTDLLDMQQPELVAAGTNVGTPNSISVRNNFQFHPAVVGGSGVVSTTIRLSRSGIRKAAN